MTKLANTLPPGDSNGLEALSAALVANPKAVHAVIALIDCKRVVTDNDSGATEPTARIRRIEVMVGEDIALAEKAMRRALEKRTGQTTLPLDLEDELAAVFGLLLDPETGELTEEAPPVKRQADDEDQA